MRIFHQKNPKNLQMWNLTNNLTNSRYIHRERLSLFFLFPFHTDTVKSITSKLFWFCFSFSFLLPSIIEISSSLKKKNETVPCLCHTSSTRKTFKVPTATSSRNIWKCKKKLFVWAEVLFSFHFTVLSFKEIFDTVKTSKQSDFGVSKVYKDSFWKTV